MAAQHNSAVAASGAARGKPRTVVSYVIVGVITALLCLGSSAFLSLSRSAVGSTTVARTESAWFSDSVVGDHILPFGHAVQVSYSTTWKHTVYWYAGSLGQDDVRGSFVAQPGRVAHFVVQTNVAAPDAWFTIRIGKLTTPLQVRLSP